MRGAKIFDFDGGRELPLSHANSANETNLNLTKEG